MDFLLVLIELFSLDFTAEVLGAKTDRKSVVPLKCCQSKFRVEEVAPHQPFFFSEN